MSFVITNLIIPSGCDDVIIHLKKLRTQVFFSELRLKTHYHSLNYPHYNRHRNHGNWEP